jgi:hypothetical protein
MANTLLTPDMITKEALRVLHQKLNFVGNIDRQYDNSFAKSGAKIGDTLRIRKPVRYTVTDGATLGTQDSTETSVSLPITNQKHVPMSFTSEELTLDIDDFSKRFIEPAMAQLAASVEFDVLSNRYKDVFNLVGTPGSAVTFKNILESRKKLNDNLAPMDGERCVTMNTQANVDLVDGLKGLFQDSSQISKQYKEGLMGVTAGYNFYENTLIPSHTAGAGVDDAYLVNGAAESGSAITVDGGAGALVKGDVFTIAGVFMVHPETRQSTGVLQQFTVTANYAGGAGDISISPPITASGAYQTVSNVPADNAPLTFVGTASTAFQQSLAFHKSAFTFATADLVLPQGVDFASRQTYDGISLRIIRQYDINTDAFPCRVDVLYGSASLYPQLASRVANN